MSKMSKKSCKIKCDLVHEKKIIFLGASVFLVHRKKIWEDQHFPVKETEIGKRFILSVSYECSTKKKSTSPV